MGKTILICIWSDIVHIDFQCKSVCCIVFTWNHNNSYEGADRVRGSGRWGNEREKIGEKGGGKTNFFARGARAPLRQEEGTRGRGSKGADGDRPWLFTPSVMSLFTWIIPTFSPFSSHETMIVNISKYFRCAETYRLFWLQMKIICIL